MCRAGVGISFQPIRATASLVQTGELEVVLPQWRGVPHELYAAVARALTFLPLCASCSPLWAPSCLSRVQPRAAFVLCSLSLDLSS